MCIYIYVRVAHRGAYICIKYWPCVSSSQVAIHRRFHPLIKQLIDTRIPYWLDCVSAQLSRTLVDSWMDAFLFFSFFLSAAEETRLTAGNSLDGRMDGAANFHGWKLERWIGRRRLRPARFGWKFFNEKRGLFPVIFNCSPEELSVARTVFSKMDFPRFEWWSTHYRQI